MGPLERRLRAIERRIGGSKEFRDGVPPLDEDGLPVWDGATPLSVDGYMRALGFAPNAELTDPELAARDRLSPYSETFEALAEQEDPDVTT